MRDAQGTPTTSYYQAESFSILSAVGKAIVDAYGTFLSDYYILCAEKIEASRRDLFLDRPDFNDHPATTFEDVELLLKDAIKRAGGSVDRLTEGQLAKILDRFKALPACEVWSVYSRDYEVDGEIVRPFSRYVGDERIPTPAFAVRGVYTIGDGAESAMEEAMAKWIFHARTDIPAMLTEIEALKRERNELQSKLKEARRILLTS